MCVEGGKKTLNGQSRDFFRPKSLMSSYSVEDPSSSGPKGSEWRKNHRTRLPGKLIRPLSPRMGTSILRVWSKSFHESVLLTTVVN